MAWAYRTSGVGGTSRLSGPCRLQVDDELEFDRLQDRQVGRLCAFEDRCHTERDDTSADYRLHSSSASLASACSRSRDKLWNSTLVKQVALVAALMMGMLFLLVAE
jgi:hypothetical protein